MGSKANWWNCPEIVETIPFPSRYKTTLEILALADYEHEKYFKDTIIPALDIDGYEKERTKKGENQRTVDAFIGICNEREGKKVNQRLLPVELRMKYKTERHLDADKLQEKLSHSSFLVKNIDERITIDSAYSLIFDESVIQLMTGWLERIKRAKTKVRQWQALSPEGLCNYINLGTEFPYTPRKEGKEISERIESIIKEQNIKAIEEMWPEIRQYIETCDRKYLHGECRYLASKLSEVIKIIGMGFQQQDEEENLMLELLKEDIEDVVKHWIEA